MTNDNHSAADQVADHVGDQDVGCDNVAGDHGGHESAAAAGQGPESPTMPVLMPQCDTPRARPGRGRGRCLRQRMRLERDYVHGGVN